MMGERVKGLVSELVYAIDRPVGLVIRLIGDNTKMIDASSARTKSNEVIDFIKQKALKNLTPTINAEIVREINRGNKIARVIIADEMNNAQRSQAPQLSFIKYQSDKHVIEAIAEELTQHGYKVSTGFTGSFDKEELAYNGLVISWDEDGSDS